MLAMCVAKCRWNPLASSSMQNLSVALLLALLVAGGGAAELYQHEHCSHLIDMNQLGRLGDTTYIHDYVDCMIPAIIGAMGRHGLNPLDLPDLYEGVNFSPAIITYNAGVYLIDGKMHQMDSIYRSGDAWTSHFANMHRIHCRFGFSNLDFNYNYRTEVMYAAITGRVVGTLEEMHAVVDVMLDRNNCEIHLQQFSLEHRRMRARLEGNILTDWLVNPMISMFTRVFDDVIMQDVENKMRAGMQEEIMDINNQLKDIPGVC